MEMKKLIENKFHKCCWYFGACLLACVSVVGIIVFYLLFGCAYELVKCYIKEKYKRENEEDSMIVDELKHTEKQEQAEHPESNAYPENNENPDQNYNELRNNTYQRVNLTLQQKREEEMKKEEDDEIKFTGTDWFLMVLIGFCGWLLQPMYLLFYILYGLMECYRRFNCWFYYAG